VLVGIGGGILLSRRDQRKSEARDALFTPRSRAQRGADDARAAASADEADDSDESDDTDDAGGDDEPDGDGDDDDHREGAATEADQQ